ncbi:hypothetical protein EMCRGX_G022599 [Ephydatia muelleri]
MDSTSLAWGQIFKLLLYLLSLECQFICLSLELLLHFVLSNYQVTSDTKDVRSSVWRLLVHLFLSGGLTAVLSVSLLASKRLSLLV